MSPRIRCFTPLIITIGLALLLTNAPIALSTSSPAILINEFMPKPSSGAEWVELYNPNPFDVDIAGWKIDDDTIGGSQTTIGAGTLIPANGLLVVSLTTNILNDTGADAAQLLDMSGATIDIHAYSSATGGQSFARVPDAGATWAKGEPSQGTWNAPPGPTPAPTYTPTPTNTSTNTPTDTPISTVTPTQAATPTSAPTNTPTPASSPTATPFPTGIVIDEFLAYPKTLYTHEWVELFNNGVAAADLSGWQLDDIEAGGAPYALPANTLIPPGGYLVISLPSALLNNDGDSVRLLRPDGVVADSTSYATSAADISRARAADGAWYDSAMPTPGAPNTPPAPTGTPTTTPTNTPTSATALATPIVWSAGVILSEFLAYPKTLYTHEWVELYNGGVETVDLSGWQLDDGEGGGTPYTLPAATEIAPGEYLAIDLPAALLNNDGDSVRLLRPDGTLGDATSYGSSIADQSHSRDASGAWYLSAANTPGGPNAGPAVPSPTNTPSPTRTPSPTHTPSPTRTPAPTRTPSPTRTPTPTRTPKPARALSQPTPIASAMDAIVSNSIKLSEFLPNPKTRYTNEWVELVNDGDVPIDLGGWALDDAAGGGAPYPLPDNSAIAPHGLLVVLLPKALLNNGGDTLRLLLPDGSVADQYSYGQSGADASFCRVEQGWSRCEPTPNAPNRAAMSPETPAAQGADAPPTLALADPSTAAASAGLSSGTPTPTPRLPARSSGDLAGATPYAGRAAGVLYRGLATSAPTLSPPPPRTAAPARPRALPPRPADRPAPPLGMGAGLFLCAAGGAVAGYDRLRSRRASQPPAPTPQEEIEEETVPSL